MVSWFSQEKRKTQLQYAGIALMLFLVVEIGFEHVSYRSLAISAYQNIAAISTMNAAVPSNPYNSLAMQFDQKEKELSTREQELMQKEEILSAKIEEANAVNRRMVVFVLGGVTILLLLLILLNFYFDVKREEGRTRDHHEEGNHELTTTL